jgi:hypothetical protein
MGHFLRHTVSMPCDEGALRMICKHDAMAASVCVCVGGGSQSWPSIACSERPYIAGVLTRSLIALRPNLPSYLPTGHSLRNHEFNIHAFDALHVAAACTSITHVCPTSTVDATRTRTHSITHSHSHAHLRLQTTARARTGRSRTVNRRRAASGSTRDARSGVRAQATAQTHASRTGGECVSRGWAQRCMATPQSNCPPSCNQSCHIRFTCVARRTIAPALRTGRACMVTLALRVLLA